MKNKRQSMNYKIVILGTTAILAKFVITKLDFQSVKWLMHPVKTMVEYATGLLSVTTEEGYLFPNNVLLSFECSGIHFFTICLLSFWFLLAQSKPIVRASLFALLLAYLVTIVANTSRILFFMSSSSAYAEYFFSKQIAHQLLGGVIFCFWLIASSLLLNHQTKPTYEIV